MFVRRSVLAAALLALAVTVGCTRAQARRAPRPLAPASGLSAQEYDARGLAVAPSPPVPSAPQPPPAPGVAPPRPDALTGIVPPLPGPGSADRDAPIFPTSGAEYPVAAGPIRERIQKRREERKERREDRDREEDERKEKERQEQDKGTPKEPEKSEPTPPPAVPDRPASPPPAVPDLPPPAAPSSPAFPQPLPTVPTSPPTVSVPLGAPAVVSGQPEPAGPSAKQLVEAAAKRWSEITDFEARLVKREVVNGKPLPTDEIEYRYRRQPHSVYMRVLSEAGQGREVMYVHGKFGNQMHVVTGKGDNVLVGAGYKTEVDPDSRTAASKSRHRIYDAGMGRTVAGLAKNIDSVKALGAVPRKEYPHPLEGVEQTIRPGADPLLPKGGRRQVYFDPKPESPSYMLPVLVTTHEPDGREVEYYCFDRMRVPAGLTDADWNPDRLGKRR